MPKIGYLLENVEGGFEHVIEALRLSREEDAITFIKEYDTIPKSDREHLSIEEICVAAGIDTRRMASLAATALMEHSLLVTKLRVGSGIIPLTQKTIEMARTKEGAADRRLLRECFAFWQAQEFARQSANLRRREEGPHQLSDVMAEASNEAPSPG